MMDFIKQFKDKNYYISLKFLINSFNKSPLKVSFFLFKIFKKRCYNLLNKFYLNIMGV